jgi:Raf kinase inhibitor-like YbhB/YbcL family protein
MLRIAYCLLLTAYHRPALFYCQCRKAKMETKQLIITSPAFEDGGTIPARYTCDGEEINPPLHIDDWPEGTVTLALIVEDPDAPKGTFDHWLVWNIDPVNEIAENNSPGISGSNSAGKTGYHGPCPPNGYHRYFFFVFALDTELDIPAGSDRSTMEQAMAGHIIGQGNIMGNYGRKQKGS